ncbi:MAG: glycoside hydrolase family 24 [Xanthobacteraceae bacterium]|jgi:hypothetical protein|nr:glycoside hydrolase family 24 [Xanthobacteraceae bacterium]
MRRAGLRAGAGGGAGGHASAAATISVGYFDPGKGLGKGWCGSTAARYIRAKLWRQACDAQTAWNRAGGKVVQGLVNRREMGDASRIGEGEICVTGLQ